MAKRITVLGAAALAIAAVASSAHAADVSAARFDNLKAMAGDWIRSGGDGSVAASYHVTAAGTAVVETLFPGSPHEMVTVYTMDKGDLVLTHYCGAGNQPHMKAAKGGDATSIAFTFDGGGNIKSPKDGHMHEATFAFVDTDHVNSSWHFYENGKPTKREEFSFVRKKS